MQTPATKIARSSYDAKEYATADAAFDDMPMLNDRTLYQVARLGFGSAHYYVIEAHRVGCAGFELCGYVAAEVA